MATLKICDLSVGDWVEYEGLHYPITFVGYGEGGDGSLVNLIRPDLSCFTCKISDIHPIPITPEVLEKNGFESTTNPNVFTLTHGELQLYVSKEFDGWYMSFVNFRERLCILQVIRRGYIHQLQHALRLAGVEKEINLTT